MIAHLLKKEKRESVCCSRKTVDHHILSSVVNLSIFVCPCTSINLNHALLVSAVFVSLYLNTRSRHFTAVRYANSVLRRFVPTTYRRRSMHIFAFFSPLLSFSVSVPVGMTHSATTPPAPSSPSHSSSVFYPFLGSQCESIDQ